MLFLLFINDVGDLLCCDRCTCKLYADDVKLYTTLGVNDDDIAHIQNSLNVLYTWFNTWQLNISTSKCATMQIHAVAECSNLRLNSITVTKANEFKDLGVIIDENLKFTSHINHVVAKATSV